MALIRTLTISTTTFERMKEKFYGFRQTKFSEPNVRVAWLQMELCQVANAKIRNHHFGFCLDFWLGIESIADEESMCLNFSFQVC